MKKKLLALILALLMVPAVMALAAQPGFADSMMKGTYLVLGGSQSVAVRTHLETGGRGGYSQAIYALELTGAETRAELDDAARKLLTGDAKPVWADGLHCYHGGSYELDLSHEIRAQDLKPGSYLYVCYTFGCDGGYNHKLTPYYDRISTLSIRVTEKAEGLRLRYGLIDSQGREYALLEDGGEGELPLFGGAVTLEVKNSVKYPVERILDIRADFDPEQQEASFAFDGRTLEPILCGSGSITVTIGNYLDETTRTETVHLRTPCSPQESYTVVSEPLCEEEGLAVYRCPGYGINCEREFDQVILEATGHLVEHADEILEPSTATKAGLGLGTCEKCGESGLECQVPPIFTDVQADSFYGPALDHCYAQGWVSGLSADTFGPMRSCVRAQVVTFLWRAAGEPEPEGEENPFVDVKPGEFYYDAVLWAVEQGITTGTDATHFSPMGACNRAQVVTFLWRAFGEPQAQEGEQPFLDVQPGSWYEQPVLWAVEEGITSGMSATAFGPGSKCNRAQIVTFLYRAYAEA